MGMTEQFKITTTGADGTAIGTITTRPLAGMLNGVALNFHPSAPATTATTITALKNDGTLVLYNGVVGNTDGYKILTQPMLDNTGTDQSQESLVQLSGNPITISIAAANALAPALTVSFDLKR